MEPIIQLNSLCVKFDTSIERIYVLDHVSLHVNKGEIVGIIGASGSGKSTLAKTILGLEARNQSTDGLVQFYDGTQSLDLLSQSKNEWEGFRKKVATMVFQNPLFNLNPSSTIKKHFDRLLGLQQKGNNDEVVLNALAQVDLGNDVQSILSAYPHQLSGGQQQRVLIALAICQQVQLLLLDEPMSSLDKKNQDGVSSILQRLVRQKQMSILLISHDLHIIGALSDRIYVMNEGKVVEEGTKKNILTNPKHAYTKALVDAQKVGIKAPSKHIVNPIIEIKGLSHTYKKGGFLSINKSKVTALKGINLSIHKGSVTGLVGPSGSGKTTLVKVLVGIEEIQSGKIFWNGANKGKDNYSELIQIIPQNTTDALNPRMLLDDQLKEVYNKHYGNVDTFEKVISSLLSDVHLDGQLRYRYPSELSGGEIQRMAIVRALIVRPEVMILDESLSALDMLVQKKLVDLILHLNKKIGMTLIMISHDDRLVSSCCDQVIHLEKGELTSM